MEWQNEGSSFLHILKFPIKANYANPYLARITFYISESVPWAERQSPKMFITVIKGFKHELKRPSLAIYNSHTYINVELCNYPFKKLFIYRQMIDVKMLHIIISLLVVYIFYSLNCQYTA